MNRFHGRVVHHHYDNHRSTIGDGMRIGCGMLIAWTFVALGILAVLFVLAMLIVHAGPGPR